MPEGPEIHRAAQRLRNALEGSTITHVECPYPTIQGQEHRFLGNQVISIEARSKAMLIHIGEDVLYSHNQLYAAGQYKRIPQNRRKQIVHYG